YKTHKGWMSSLSRWMQLLFLDKDRQITSTQVEVDQDALKREAEDTAGSYIKGLAAMTALLGAGAAGAGTPVNAMADAQNQVKIDNQNNGSLLLGS
ncbi:serine-rich glycoprotein adhesin, partial [Bartonella sp. CL63NXGY]|uniref:serine-rich glycoprotein adhesin n=1 Tax=Bartonella sp. CL63NXGY TaxID=3243538 RepID=UPI0035D09995